MNDYGVFTVAIGSSVVSVSRGWTETTFSDGSSLSARHDEQPGQRQTAAELGCSVERMNREHDLTHSLLAAWLGLGQSPTLYGVAVGEKYPLHDLEEAAVLAIQRFAIAAGVDLLALAERQ